MMRFPIAWKTMRDYRGPAIAIFVVMAAVAVLDVSIYPTYSEALKDFETPGALSGLVGQAGSLATPAGFITAEFFSWVPLMLAAFAIVAATGTTTGEEASGALDILLAQPISRTRVLLEKVSGLALAIALICVLTYVPFAVAKRFVDFGISDARLLAAVINLVPVTWAFLALAFAAGVLLPSRGSALMAALGLMIAAYVIYTVGSAVSSLQTLREVSPFYWSDGSQVLLHGFPWMRVAVFLVVTAALLVVAVIGFERRDITSSHTWPFARTRRQR